MKKDSIKMRLLSVLTMAALLFTMTLMPAAAMEPQGEVSMGDADATPVSERTISEEPETFGAEQQELLGSEEPETLGIVQQELLGSEQLDLLGIDSGGVSELVDGTVVNAKSVHSSGDNTIYATPEVGTWTEYNFRIHMPKAGTLRITYASTDTSGGYFECTGRSANGLYYDEKDGVKYNSRLYVINSAGDIDAKVTVYRPENASTNCVVLIADYFPAKIGTVTASSKERVRGIGTPGDNNKVREFKIKVSGKGYLRLKAGSVDGYGINIKAPGFKRYEYLSTNDYTRKIGVKKGTYTIKIKTASSAVAVYYKFYKVKESKYGTSKSKAVSIKKKSKRKGIIVTNDKKAHWYKIKNPKKQNLAVVINANNMNGGGNGTLGGVTATFVFPNGSSQTKTVYAGQTATISLYYDTYGSQKARKGTYKVKISSYNGGNGYFTVKWK
jgi:hypothetical protein